MPDRSEEVRAQNDVVSPLLSLASTDSVGRHVVAGGGSGAGVIPAGTVLLRETPFAWSLHPEFNGAFCAHCLCEVRGIVWHMRVVLAILLNRNCSCVAPNASIWCVRATFPCVLDTTHHDMLSRRCGRADTVRTLPSGVHVFR